MGARRSDAARPRARRAAGVVAPLSSTGIFFTGWEASHGQARRQVRTGHRQRLCAARRRAAAALRPPGYTGAADDIARSVVRPASGETKFVISSRLMIDGGCSCR
jgi:hypothetical protein